MSTNQDKQRIEKWMNKRNLTPVQIKMGKMMIEAGYGYASATRNMRYLDSSGSEYDLARRCYISLVSGKVHGAVGVRGRTWTRNDNSKEIADSEESHQAHEECTEVESSELSVEEYVLELLGSSLSSEAKVFFFASLVNNLDTSIDND